MKGKYDSDECQKGSEGWRRNQNLQYIANEQARANEIHKLELEIYLAPRYSVRADQDPEMNKTNIEKNNQQREVFKKRVQDV